MDENRVTARKRLEAQLIDRAMKDELFREELVRDPKGVFARELGITVPEHINVEVVEERPTTVYLVLPPTPASAGAELSDQELEAVAGGGWSEDTGECGHSCDWGTCVDTCGCYGM
jgi:hypothetical protein